MKTEQKMALILQALKSTENKIHTFSNSAIPPVVTAVSTFVDDDREALKEVLLNELTKDVVQ